LAPVAGWLVELEKPLPEPALPPELPPPAIAASEPVEDDAAVALADAVDGPELAVVSDAPAAAGVDVV
jgi:hypothetical protein